MCIAIVHQYDELELKVYFARSGAKLPLQTKSGQIKLVAWGRRPGERGMLPMGGWARLSTIHGGRWDLFQPMPVKLAIARFAEQDIQCQRRWHHVMRGQYVQGLLATHKQEQRAYIVTIIPVLETSIYQRWPRILFEHSCFMRNLVDH